MKTIQIDKDILNKTPEILRNLPRATYSLTKLKRKENPTHASSRIPVGAPLTGGVKIIDRGGGPSIVIGLYPLGGMITSWVLEAFIPDGENYIEITTENSVYKLEGPLAEEEEQKGD